MSDQNEISKEILDELNESINEVEKISKYFKSPEIFETIDLQDSDVIAQIDQIKVSIEKVKAALHFELVDISLKNITIYYENLIQELHTKISYLPTLKVNSFQEICNSMHSLLQDIEGIKTLNAIADVSNTVVIVGANGSGKSSYVSNLRSVNLPGLFVIPAQKYLYFDPNTMKRNEATIGSYRAFLNKNDVIEIGKKVNTSYNEFRDSVTYPFSYLITALVKEFAEISVNRIRNVASYANKIPLWDKLEKIWEQLIPSIKFELEPNERTIWVEKDGNKYGLNALSDGEKCILFYIGNVLIAPNNSYIVVDEPETFLNPSIYNKLWDLLISIRKDCQFIFTSHTMDFINSRTNSTFVWCKKFSYPNKFELQILNNDIDFPLPLLTELVGSKKPILFCEGTYDSIDYQVLSKVFMTNFLVKPVGGHKEVINYTKGYNDLSTLHGNISFGIIDGDFLEKSSIEKYRRENIHVLPFNEIEMILVTEPIICSVLSPFHDEEEVVSIVEAFKVKFFDEMDKSQERILLDLTKKLVDRKIMGSLVEDYSSLDLINAQVKSIPDQIDVSSIFSENKEKFKNYLDNHDYTRALRFCNLKGQIINGLGNKLLMSDYKNMALRRIAQNNELQTIIRQEYFSELPIEERD